jgi:hypothetical protein
VTQRHKLRSSHIFVGITDNLVPDFEMVPLVESHVHKATDLLAVL